eukprot:COSAG06_NODE_60453_length_271_cov_0.226744_1_plen_38_part_01
MDIQLGSPFAVVFNAVGAGGGGCVVPVEEAGGVGICSF